MLHYRVPQTQGTEPPDNGKDVGSRTSHCWWGRRWCSHLGRQVVVVTKLNLLLAYVPLGIYPRELKLTSTYKRSPPHPWLHGVEVSCRVTPGLACRGHIVGGL